MGKASACTRTLESSRSFTISWRNWDIDFNPQRLPSAGSRNDLHRVYSSSRRSVSAFAISPIANQEFMVMLVFTFARANSAAYLRMSVGTTVRIFFGPSPFFTPREELAAVRSPLHFWMQNSRAKTFRHCGRYEHRAASRSHCLYFYHSPKFEAPRKF